MIEFDAVVTKLGEHGVQSILENWERYEGISYSCPVSLENRWTVFMRKTDGLDRAAA